MHFFALFTITNRNFVLWRVLTLLISSHPFTLSIYHILDFWCKIRFRIHIIIIQGQMHPLKKKTTVVFFDGFPYLQLVIVHHLVADGRKKELLILLQPKACLVVNCNCHLGSPVVSSLFSMQNS